MAGSTGNAVVLRFRNGRTTRGVLTRDFNARDFAVDAKTDDGETLRTNISDLKAVFFLKDPRRRDAEIHVPSEEPDKPTGAIARVEFFDGEVIHGRVQEYTLENSGFFLYPTSPDSNNEMIFVVARALHTVSLEG